MKESTGRILEIAGPKEYSLIEMLEAIRFEFGLSGTTMTIPSQLSGKAFEMATKVLPKNTTYILQALLWSVSLMEVWQIRL